MRLLFGQSLSSGYGVGSPDRLFGFSSYSKRSRSAAVHFTSLNFFLEEGAFRLQDQSGFGLLDLLDRTEETGHFCVTFWILVFRSWSFEFLFLLLQERRRLSQGIGPFQCAWMF